MSAFTVSDASRQRIVDLRRQHGEPDARLRISIDGIK
jgi:Fe-S cluster assembly iron-binding protein IscA